MTGSSGSSRGVIPRSRAIQTALQRRWGLGYTWAVGRHWVPRPYLVAVVGAAAPSLCWQQLLAGDCVVGRGMWANLGRFYHVRVVHTSENDIAL